MTFLDYAFNAIATRLELASGVPAATTDAQIITGTESKGSEPPYSDAPHLHFRARYAGCRTDTQRRDVINDALSELRALRYAQSPSVDRDTIEGRMMIGRDPRPARTVAYVYGYSIRHIYNLRAEAKRRDAA